MKCLKIWGKEDKHHQEEAWCLRFQLVAEDIGPCSCNYEYKTNVYMSSYYDVIPA